MSEYVVPEPGSRLDQLAAQYDSLYLAELEAAERLKTCKDAIKAELAAARPGAPSVTLASPKLAKPLRLTSKTSWRVDTAKLKKEYPAIYAYAAKQSTSWELRAT